MADSYNKKEREKKRRKRKENKAERKRQKKIDGVKSEEFMYVDEDGNLTSTPPDRSKRRETSLEEIQISTPKDADIGQNKFLKTGKVKFFNPEKRYGFIEDIATRADYFVHADNLIDAIRENDTVHFEVGSGPKGPIAINVKQYKEEQEKEEEE